VKFSSGSRTDVGRGRPENEDSILVDDAGGLWAVADGMGGHRAGEVASATAIDTLQAAYQAGRPLDEAVEDANAAVFAKSADDPALRGMGTTLTAIAVRDGHTAVLGHVGDSRAYLLRDGTVTQVTEDHSLVEQLVREGRLRPEEAQRHPQRAIITRALGVDAHVEVDTYRVDLKAGDRLLICSDGLTNMLSDETIAATLRRHADPQQAADNLVDMANQAGGDDNITVVVLDALADGSADGVPAAGRASVTADTEPEPVIDATAVEPPAVEAPAGEPPAVEAPALEAPAVEAPAAGDRPPRRTPPPARRFRGVLVWALPIVFLVAVGVGALGWYARRTYYVGLSADRVAVFKGVPGGLLGWDPTVDHQTALTTADLTDADRRDLQNGHRFASRGDADRFVARLQQTHEALAGTTTTSTGAPAEVAPTAVTTGPAAGPTETTR
jgi:PPM family protein phosphatase